MLNENLKKILQNKNLETLYTDFGEQKIFILQFDQKLKVFSFEDKTILFLDNNEEFIPFKIEDFTFLFKEILENIKKQNTQFQNIIEYKENMILKGNSIKNFLKKSFVLKQKINKNFKFLILLKDSLKMLLNDYIFLKKILKLLLLNIDILINSIKDNLSRLDALYILSSSIKNETMNKNIYLLSVLSVIFLPLNLIVGFFGMNTKNLFLENNPYGTLYIFFSICCILIFGLLYYKSKKVKEFEFDDYLKKK